MAPLSDPCTLITGATSGLGRAIALHLSGRRRLLLSGRNLQKLEALRNACTLPERHAVWAQDLTRVEEIRPGLSAVLAAGALCVDHFIHSAGLTGIQLARALEPGFVEQVFNVNLFAAMEITGILVQRKHNRGALRSVTLISSIASNLGATGYSVYAASKGAVNSLARSLAIELAPTVRVNTILPGIIQTEMTREYFENGDFLELYPLGAGCPEDVASAAAFLSSDGARWVTGQEFVVDGGRSVFSPTS